MSLGLDISNLDMELAEISLVPDLRKCALLLDIDGTILDLAPAPQQVWVPAGLRQTLARLDALTGGALALVSGRALNDIDLIFSPLELAAIGGHGAELRIAAGSEPVMRAKPLSTALKRRSPASLSSAPAFSRRTKAIRLPCTTVWRRKEAMPCARRSIRPAQLRRPGTVEILPGKLVLEIKPAGINKATAVCELMDYPPFANRNPIFIGDDTTDVPVFGIISRFGGLGFSVGHVAADVNGHFEKPESVRAWLARIAN